jgi:hypothetical protein
MSDAGVRVGGPCACAVYVVSSCCDRGSAAAAVVKMGARMPESRVVAEMAVRKRFARISSVAVRECGAKARVNVSPWGAAMTVQDAGSFTLPPRTKCPFAGGALACS